jgi:hypothetical protein
VAEKAGSAGAGGAVQPGPKKGQKAKNAFAARSGLCSFLKKKKFSF